MSKSIQFETPENVVVQYEPAGLGTRFVAWLVDQIIFYVGFFLLFFVLILIGSIGSTVVDEYIGMLDNPDDLFYVSVGVGIVIGLGNFLYYGCSEFFLRGQTIGKRIASVRVVRANGFQLDAFSIFVRNIFRIVDHLPPLWIVPFLAQRSQRLGDMVGGTVVIKDKPGSLAEEGNLRQRLLSLSPAQATFRFDSSQLSKVQAQDFEAIERVLGRWHEINPTERLRLAEHIANALALRLNVPRPDPTQHYQFLEELLAAEYRRQYRQLG